MQPWEVLGHWGTRWLVSFFARLCWPRLVHSKSIPWFPELSIQIMERSFLMGFLLVLVRGWTAGQLVSARQPIALPGPTLAIYASALYACICVIYLNCLKCILEQCTGVRESSNVRKWFFLRPPPPPWLRLTYEVSRDSLVHLDGVNALLVKYCK